jgi:hypothetical protein
MEMSLKLHEWGHNVLGPTNIQASHLNKIQYDGHFTLISFHCFIPVYIRTHPRSIRLCDTLMFSYNFIPLLPYCGTLSNPRPSRIAIIQYHELFHDWLHLFTGSKLIRSFNPPSVSKSTTVDAAMAKCTENAL